MAVTGVAAAAAGGRTRFGADVLRGVGEEGLDGGGLGGEGGEGAALGGTAGFRVRRGRDRLWRVFGHGGVRGISLSLSFPSLCRSVSLSLSFCSVS